MKRLVILILLSVSASSPADARKHSKETEAGDFVVEGVGPPDSWLLVEPEHRDRASRLWKTLRQEPRAEDAAALARILIEESYAEECVTLLQQGIEAGIESPQLYVLLASAIVASPQRDNAEATEVLSQGLIKYPNNAGILLQQAYNYEQSGSLEQAIVSFRKALDATDDATVALSAHLGLSGILKRIGEAEEARRHLDAAREVYPNVDDLLRAAAIWEQSPKPTGRGSTGGGNSHPSHERRIDALLTEIERDSERTPQ